MWTCLFCLLLFRTAVLSLLHNPTNVTFTSVNFRNILQWSPGKGNPADTKYRVHYAIYGVGQWRPVLHCTDITRTWCDLSKETSDPEQGYYAKVRAVSRKIRSEWVWTQRFSPKFDTVFGPPRVSLEVDDKYAIVTLKGPMKYLPHKKTPQVSMATLFPEMIYILSINNTRSGQISHITMTRNEYKYPITDHGTIYCFSATTQSTYMPSKHQPSAWHCISTPEVPLIGRQERIAIISTVIPVVLLSLLAAGGYILHKYLLGTDQKSPDNLTMPTILPPPLPVRSENINIIVIPVSKDAFPINKLYPKLPNPSSVSESDEAPVLVDVLGNSEGDDYGFMSRYDDVADCNLRNQDYKSKGGQIIAESSGSTFASQNSFLQPSLSSVSLDQSGESWQGLSLHENIHTGPLQEQIIQETGSANDGEGENMVSSGYASQNVSAAQPSNQLQLPDDYGFVSSTGYASQNTIFKQPINQDGMSGSFGLVGLAAGQEEEDSDSLQINWSPSTRRLVIPGLDLGTEQGEGGSPTRPRMHLDTVFVRQPSEEEALLGAERGGSGQWDTEEFIEKWNLVVSNY